MSTLLSSREVAVFFDRSPLGLAIVGLDGRYKRVNAALCQLLGYMESELINRTCMSLTHPDDLSMELIERASLINSDKPRTVIEKRYLTKSGYSVAVRVIIEVIRDDENNPLHYAAQVEPLTNSRARLERQPDGSVTARPIIKVNDLFRDNWKTLIPILGTILTSIVIPIVLLYLTYLDVRSENAEIARELKKANDLNFTLIQTSITEGRIREVRPK